jgi:hypothetical protein
MRVDDDIADGIELAAPPRPAGVRTLLTLIERRCPGRFLVGLANGNAGHAEIVDRKRLVVGTGYIFVGEVEAYAVGDKGHALWRELSACGAR